jgi:hypothetical protein
MTEAERRAFRADEHNADAVHAMLPQLLIVLINRLGGKVKIPVKEVDDTGRYLLAMRVDPVTRRFEFEVKRKQ